MARPASSLTTNAPSRRSQQLRELAAEFCRVHTAWVDDANKHVPDEAYWDAADAMVESFAEGDIPGDCRELADAVNSFAVQIYDYDNREDLSEVYPPDAFWAARDKVGKAIQFGVSANSEAKPLPPLESIAMLRAQGVGDFQIAKIYGFKDRNGNWLQGLVQKEIDQPGSVLKTPGAVDGRDWSDPRVKSDDAGNEAAERHATALAEKRKSARGRRAEPCPESPQELWQQNVSIGQAAKMLQRDEDEVAAMFADFEAEREAAILGGGAPDATTQAIRELAAAGKTVKQIVSELSVGPDQVKKAMTGVTATPAAAGV